MSLKPLTLRATPVVAAMLMIVLLPIATLTQTGTKRRNSTPHPRKTSLAAPSPNRANTQSQEWSSLDQTRRVKCRGLVPKGLKACVNKLEELANKNESFDGQADCIINDGLLWAEKDKKGANKANCAIAAENHELRYMVFSTALSWRTKNMESVRDLLGRIRSATQ